MRNSLWLVFLIFSGLVLQAQEDVRPTTTFKRGCNDAANQRGTTAASVCIGAVTVAIEAIILTQRGGLLEQNICLPKETGMLVGDYINKSYLVRNDEPITWGIFKVLADTFPCKK